MCTGDPIELEQINSANAPLGVDHLHAHRRRQLHCHGAGEAALMAGLFAAAVSLFADVLGSLHVHAAVCRQAAQRLARSLDGAERNPGPPPMDSRVLPPAVKGSGWTYLATARAFFQKFPIWEIDEGQLICNIAPILGAICASHWSRKAGGFQRTGPRHSQMGREPWIAELRDAHWKRATDVMGQFPRSPSAE